MTVGHIREDHDRLGAIADYLDAHDPDARHLVELAKERIAELKRPAA